MTDFSRPTVKVRSWWNDILNILREYNFQLRIVYIVKSSVKNEREIMTLSDKNRVSCKKQSLKEILEDVI